MANKFVTLLNKVGAVFQVVFKDATKVAVAAEPIIAVAFPAISGLFNMTVSLATGAEAAAVAAGAQGNTGAAKSALIISALETYITQEATALGIKAPTTAQVQTWINAVVAALNAFEASPNVPVSTAVSEGTKA